MVYLANELERRFELMLVPFGITVPQFKILRALRKLHPDGAPIYNQHQFLPGAKSDVSRLVSRMEKEGLAVRKKCKEDKRVIYAIITDKGLAIMTELDNHQKKFMLNIGELSEDQIGQFYEITQIMVEAVSKDI